MSSDMEALKDALTRQLEVIDVDAQLAGCARELLRTPDGGYVAAPVLVALANVEIALLAQPDLNRCRCREGDFGIAYACPVHGHMIARPTDA